MVKTWVMILIIMMMMLLMAIIAIIFTVLIFVTIGVVRITMKMTIPMVIVSNVILVIFCQNYYDNDGEVVTNILKPNKSVMVKIMALTIIPLMINVLFYDTGGR